MEEREMSDLIETGNRLIDRREGGRVNKKRRIEIKKGQRGKGRGRRIRRREGGGMEKGKKQRRVIGKKKIGR